jgi:hypothetical protein
VSYLSPAVLKHNEDIAKTLRKAENICRKNTLDAVKLIGQVVRDPAAKDSDRLKAAGMILDRVWGRAPEHVTVDLHQPPWAVALRDMMIVGNEQQARAIDLDGDVIDAEVVEDDPTFE